MVMEVPRFIDAHHHLWDLSACHYPWLMEKGVKRFFGDPTQIQKNYQVADLLAESTRWRPEKSVHIQVGVDESQNLQETQWLQTQADTLDFPHAIIAFCDLSQADAQLEINAQRQYQNLRGIRQIIGRHQDEDKNNGSAMLLQNPQWQQNFATLAKHNLSFDLQLTAAQLPEAYQVLKDFTEVNIAICHCASPWDQSASGLAKWRADLSAMATLPNTVCKISGLGMFNQHWDKSNVSAIAQDVITIFSSERCMFGSNFPVDKLYTDYDTIWDTYLSITNQYTSIQQQQLFYQTAKNFYRL